MADPTHLTLLALLPLIAWRMVSRIRRMIGRQKLSRIRPWATIIVFPLLLAFISIFAYPHWERLWWLAGGLALGAALGVFGLRKTRFEATPEGMFYTPNMHLGIALSVLLVARIGWRMVEVFTMDPAVMQQQDQAFMRSPLTLVVLGVLAGYYITYAAGLVRWRWRALRRTETAA